jgi:hypothetical protein
MHWYSIAIVLVKKEMHARHLRPQNHYGLITRLLPGRSYLMMGGLLTCSNSCNNNNNGLTTATTQQQQQQQDNNSQQQQRLRDNLTTVIAGIPS